MNKKIWLVVIVIIVVIGIYGFSQSKNAVAPTSTTTDTTTGKTFGEFKIQSKNSGFCGNDQIFDSNNQLIVTLRLCEDNIHQIDKKGDWMIVTTDSNRSFQKNLVTDEEILNSEGGIGEMSKVE